MGQAEICWSFRNLLPMGFRTVYDMSIVKGYLCYKMIISQNVLSDAQVKSFSIL